MKLKEAVERFVKMGGIEYAPITWIGPGDHYKLRKKSNKKWPDKNKIISMLGGHSYLGGNFPKLDNSENEIIVTVYRS